MDTKLDEQLCKKYPEIFQNRHKSMHDTCMCWGFECGDGWYQLIDSLCHNLMSDVRQAKYNIKCQEDYWERHPKGPPADDEWEQNEYGVAALKLKKEALNKAMKEIPVADQVKEKFGELRFYYHRGTPEHETMIDMACSMSSHICEECGMFNNSVITYNLGWLKTLCPDCARKRYGEKATQYRRLYIKESDKGPADEKTLRAHPEQR